MHNEFIIIYINIFYHLCRLKEEEERKNKLAALEAVKAAKIAASTLLVTTDDTRSVKLPTPSLKPPTSLSITSRSQSLKDK